MRRIFFILIFIFIITSCGTEIEENFCPTLSDCSSAGSTGVFNTFFTDDFNRADGLIDSGTWATVNSGGSSVNILSNEIQPLSNLAFQPVAMHQILVTAASFRISVDIIVNGTDYGLNIPTGNFGIFGLSQSLANFQSAYFCGMQGGVNNDQLYLISTLGGVPQGNAVDAGNIPLTNGDVYTLTLLVDDGTLTCSISGNFTASISMADSNFTSGYSGFGGGNTAAAADGEILFDNFVLEIIQ